MKTFKWIRVRYAVSKEVAVEAETNQEAIAKLSAMPPDKRFGNAGNEKQSWKYTALGEDKQP